MAVGEQHKSTGTKGVPPSAPVAGSLIGYILAQIRRESKGFLRRIKVFCGRSDKRVSNIRKERNCVIGENYLLAKMGSRPPDLLNVMGGNEIGRLTSPKVLNTKDFLYPRCHVRFYLQTIMILFQLSSRGS